MVINGRERECVIPTKFRIILESFPQIYGIKLDQWQSDTWRASVLQLLSKRSIQYWTVSLYEAALHHTQEKCSAIADPSSFGPFKKNLVETSLPFHIV